MQDIILYGHWGAPNPWKVATILEELALPYQLKLVEFADVKNPGFIKINPNGRLPAIIDPNTGMTLWESGAIVLYLVETYDKQGLVSFAEGPEKFLCQQWLMFQVSGQGPYFGQATWFARFHPEKIASATDRYVTEMLRVIEVLNTVLTGRRWLVGEKCTYADLCFVTWADVGKGLLLQLGKRSELDRFAAYQGWMARLHERGTVNKINEVLSEGRKAHGLP